MTDSSATSTPTPDGIPAHLRETADAVWLAAHGAPPIEDDPVAKMLGITPTPADDGTTPDADLKAWQANSDGTPAPWREGDCAGHEPDGHHTRWCYCRRNALRYPVVAAPTAAGQDQREALAQDEGMQAELAEVLYEAFYGDAAAGTSGTTRARYGADAALAWFAARPSAPNP